MVAYFEDLLDFYAIFVPDFLPAGSAVCKVMWLTYAPVLKYTYF